MLLSATRLATAQELPASNINPNFFNTFNCFPGASRRPAAPIAPTANRPNTRWSEYGYALTPRGTLRVMVIYAGFTNDNVAPNVPGSQNIPNNNSSSANPWPQQLNGSVWGESLPRNAASTFYTSSSQFSTSATDQSLSNYYYQLSQFSTSPLQMQAVNFPVRVNVTATTNDNWSWSNYNQMVLDKIRTEPALQAHMTALNRSLLDARTNTPDYQFDNSLSGPDNKIDYTVIIWRYDSSNPTGTSGLEGAEGSAGGFAHLIDIFDTPVTLISASGSTPALITNKGFTACRGFAGINHDLFAHEFAHTLYWAPHVNTANGVVGRKFNVTYGESMINGTINGWERYHLGWAPLQCNSANGDLLDAAALTPTRRYRMRDFITTGDVLRIRLPNTYNAATGTYQYLWLENRQRKSVWDKQAFTSDGQNPAQPFASVPAGLLAYVDDMGHTKSTPLTMSQAFPQPNLPGIGSNGFKFLSAVGNYDLAWDHNAPSPYNQHLWGNPIYNFVGWDKPNPTGGQHDYGFVRADQNGNGVITYTSNSNGSAPNEWFRFIARNNTPTDGFLGLTARFNAYRKIGLDTNPALTNFPDFDAQNQRMAPYQLSGISVKVVDYINTGTSYDLLVDISFTDTDITQSTRWTGNLNVWDVPGAPNDYDVNIKSGVNLRLDRSGTPNRTTPGTGGDFVNATYLTVKDDATFHLEDNSALKIGRGSTLYVEDKAVLEAAPTAGIIVEEGALLSVPTQSMADALRDYGQLQLATDGRMEIRETGITVSGRSGIALSVYPNPAASGALRATITGVSAAQAATYQYRLLTPYGQTVRHGTNAGAMVELSKIPAGTYLLEFSSPTGQRLTQRVQVQP